MRILLSNDDGVYAKGIKILYKTLKNIAEVWVVAPMEEKSTTSHTVTLHRPLRITDMGNRIYGVNGFPADCTYLALREIMKKPPDLVVSGINRGANLAQDVFYSGTLSAAREAAIQGIPALAVSLDLDFKHSPAEKKLHYESAAILTAQVIKKIFMKVEWPTHMLLNLNVPDLALSKIKGIRLSKQGFRNYSNRVLKRKDHRGRDYYWIGGPYKGYKKVVGSDCESIASGYAALSPLQIDCTDYNFLKSLNRQSEKFEIINQKI